MLEELIPSGLLKPELPPQHCWRLRGREKQQLVEERLEWERRMREQQRCFLEDPSHVRKRGAPRGGSYQTAPTGGFSSARDDGETLRIGARGRAGELGMYWDFGDEPPGLYCKRGHGAFPPLYRIVLTVDGEFDGEFFEEEEAWIVNIRCQLCTLVRRCPECVEEQQQRQKQPKVQAERMLAWTSGADCKRVRYCDAHSTGVKNRWCIVQKVKN